VVLNEVDDHREVVRVAEVDHHIQLTGQLFQRQRRTHGATADDPCTLHVVNFFQPFQHLAAHSSISNQPYSHHVLALLLSYYPLCYFHYTADPFLLEK
jgi:hypothetical protein